MGTLRDVEDGVAAPFDEGRSLWPAESSSVPAPWTGPDARTRPWEDWVTRAEAAGMGRELIALGAEVIRCSVLQYWPEEVRAECGHYDDGEAMIDFAQRDPDRAHARWDLLLRTDGQGDDRG